MPDSAPSDAFAPPRQNPRVAIITSYFQEERHLLERCLRSVRRQTVPSDHIVVADGHRQDWLDQAGVRHIALDRSHGDYGGTPRGVGALLAIAEDYDAFGFLDADNWLDADHVEQGFRAAQGLGRSCDYVIAQRRMMRPDETVLSIVDEPIDQHVDTNCFLFLSGAFHAVPLFALIPQQMSAIGDRLFYTSLRRRNLAHAVIPKATVNYHCLWASLYAAAGEAPPPLAKPNIDQQPIAHWLAQLTDDEKTAVARRTGLAGAI